MPEEKMTVSRILGIILMMIFFVGPQVSVIIITGYIFVIYLIWGPEAANEADRSIRQFFRGL